MWWPLSIVASSGVKACGSTGSHVIMYWRYTSLWRLWVASISPIVMRLDFRVSRDERLAVLN